MKNKNIFIKSTLILLIGGFITRAIGFCIRILYTRSIGPEGINLFSLVMPTYSMMITIATLALPITISKLVAEEKNRSIKIMSNALLIMLFINFLIIGITIFTSEFIATNLLNEPNVKYLIIAMSLTLPFVSLSSIVKGYFLGKQNTLPYMISNILEQILRLIIILLLIPKLLEISIMHAVIGLILLSIVSELFSVFIFFFFMPRNVVIKKEGLKYSKNIKNDLLGTAIPTVSGRIIGNIGYFFEPIILTNLLIFSGYSANYVISEYGAFNAYAITVLAMPSFFIQAISQTIVPEISRFKSLNNIYMVKKRIRESILFTFIVGTLFSIFIFLFRDILLNILFDTNLGSEYIKFLAPVFSIYYVEGILYSILQAIDKAKTAFKISFYGVLIKLIFLTILSLCHIGLFSLVIAEIINIIFIVTLCLIKLKREKLI